MIKSAMLRGRLRRGAVLIEVILVVAILSVLGLMIYTMVTAPPPPAPPGVVVAKRIRTVTIGQMLAPQPFYAAVTAPMPIAYVVKDITYVEVAYGASPTTWVIVGASANPPFGADVTFTLSSGDAAVNGGPTVTVPVNAQGLATAVLTPVKTGQDTLSITLKPTFGPAMPDTTTYPFEVVRTP